MSIASCHMVMVRAGRKTRGYGQQQSQIAAMLPRGGMGRCNDREAAGRLQTNAPADGQPMELAFAQRFD